jgi:hypothetical protein
VLLLSVMRKKQIDMQEVRGSTLLGPHSNQVCKPSEFLSSQDLCDLGSQFYGEFSLSGAYEDAVE